MFGPNHVPGRVVAGLSFRWLQSCRLQAIVTGQVLGTNRDAEKRSWLVTLLELD